MSYYVYFIQTEDGPIKIGVAWDVADRLRHLQTANPTELVVLNAVRCESKAAAKVLERTLHRQLQNFHIRGEWFEPAPEVFGAIHDPESDCATIRRAEMRGPPPDLGWSDPDAPPWADEVDRNNLLTLPSVHRRRIVAAASRQWGASTNR